MENESLQRGDLVEVDFGYQTKSVGIVTGRRFPPGWPPTWRGGRHHWHDTRMWVLVDGEELPVPLEQLTLLRRAK